MNAVIDPHPTEPLNKTHTPSVLQFIFGILVIILLVAGALLLFVSGILQRSDPLADPVGILQWSASLLLAALLVVPSVLYAYRRIRTGIRAGPPIGNWRPDRLRLSTALMLTMPLILLLGNWVASKDNLAYLFLPPLHVLAIAIPVFWLVSLVLRGLPAGSPQRAWGVFDAGLVLGPGIILFLEILAAILLFVLSLIYIASQPELLQELTGLVQRLDEVSEDPAAIMRLLEPYLNTPAVLTVGLIFVSGIVPLIEELLKPIGVWFISGRNLSQAEGFTAGVLSGAGFALFENLALASGGSDWALAVLVRAGTGVIHIFTAAIMGRALALAWTEKKYFSLAGTYLLAVLVHSLWNGLALFGMSTEELFPAATPGFTGVAITGLIVMLIVAFSLLLVFNRRLRQPAREQAFLAEDLEPEPEDDPPWVL